MEVRRELEQLGFSFSTHCDTEVIVYAWEAWGKQCVDRFRGMFAFAIWNLSERKLLLCRDRLGVKPLHYYHKNGLFAFGSEIKSISTIPGIDSTIDQAAVSLYLQVGYIKSPNSIFKHIRKLEPGCFLEINKNGDTKIWSFWGSQKVMTSTFS